MKLTKKQKKILKRKLKDFIIDSTLILFTTICILDFMEAIMIKLYC